MYIMHEIKDLERDNYKHLLLQLSVKALVPLVFVFFIKKIMSKISDMK